MAWKTQVGQRMGPPVVAGNHVLIPNSDRLACHDAKDGKQLWEYRPPDDDNVWAEPTVKDGTVYVTCSGEITALDLKTGAKRRRFETNGSGSAAPRLDSDGESLFAAADEGWIHCFDLETNEERWKEQVYGEIEAPLALAHDHLLFAVTYWGEVYSFSILNGAGKMWRRKLPSVITAAPTVIQQSLYVPGFKGQVFCLDTNAGAGGTRWKTERGGNVSTHLAIAGGTVFGVTGDELHAVNADSGESRWSFGLSDISTNSPVVAGDTVYVGDDSGTVYALKTSGGSGVGDTRFGAKRWKHELDGPVRDAFAVADGTLFVATDSGDNAPMLYALRED